MNYILFDDSSRDDLLPLTFTRPTADIRIGILTIREKWEKHLKSSCSYLTQDYLSEKYPKEINDENIFINGSVLPSPTITEAILHLQENQKLVSKNTILALKLNKHRAALWNGLEAIEDCKAIEFTPEFEKINYPWDIFSKNEQALEDDFKLITKGRKSQPLSKTNQCINPENIFLEEGAVVECSILNASTGSIYIGKDAEVMENSVVRGSFALCEHSALKLSSKIYGPTTIGPHSKVGGEVNNSVIFGYSNKGHDGFLGNAVLGEWCNIGADSNNSNLKNNYAEVKLWSYAKDRFINTGLQFCGLIMGDHSKCGINTMFNTGTVVGVSANIYGAGFQRNFLPSFSWGGPQGFMVYQPAKAIETAELVLKRRGLELSEEDKKILTHIFKQTEKYRRF